VKKLRITPSKNARESVSSPSNSRITQSLRRLNDDDPDAWESLMLDVYTELRRLANHYLRYERPDHTLQPTALVHEAYLRLVGQDHARWQNRAHFFGVAAGMMRRILVDHAKSHHRAKRGGTAPKVSIETALDLYQQQDKQLIELDEALMRLRELDPRKSDVVELRYFGGLSVEETAEVLGISTNTVLRDWNMAKAWLHQELKTSD